MVVVLHTRILEYFILEYSLLYTPSMSHLRSLASNTLTQLIGRVIGTTFGVFTVAVLTRSLGADGYGQLTLAMTFLAVAGALADFGFTLTTNQMISERGEDEEKIVSTAFTMRLLSGVFFFALAVLVALAMPYAFAVKAAVVVGAFSYFFMTSSQMLVGVFQKHLAMWRPALAEAASRGVILLAVIWLAADYVSVPAMMAAFTIGNLLLLVMNLAFAHRYTRIRFAIDRATAHAFLSRSWPIAISIFFNLLYLKGDILFLSFYRSDAEIGLYGAAYKVLDVVSVIPTMFMGLLLPMLVSAWKTHDREKLHTLLQQAFDVFALASLPLLGGALVLSEPIMRLMAGADFASAGRYLVILMIANTVVFFGILFGHAIVGINKQRAILPAYIVTAVATFILYFLTIPRFGAVGAAWSTVASETMIATMTTTMVLRHTKFSPRWRNALVYLLAAVVMTLGVWWTAARVDVGHGLLIALVLGGVVVYGAIVVALGGIKKETLRTLLSRAQ